MLVCTANLSHEPETRVASRLACLACNAPVVRPEVERHVNVPIRQKRLLPTPRSLMDVSGRRQLYCHVFQLVSCLAGGWDAMAVLLHCKWVGSCSARRPAGWHFSLCMQMLPPQLCGTPPKLGLPAQILHLPACLPSAFRSPAGSADLLPLLLQPADSDRLKAVMARSQAQQVQQAQQGQKQEQGSEQAEARQPSKRPRRGAGSTGRDKTEPETATEGGGAPADAAAASAPEQGSGGEAGGGGGDTSCWEALQASLGGWQG